MNIFENSFDYIGHNGPIITFVITCFYLIVINKHLYLIVFLGGFWFNLIMNDVSKSVIREPRPTGQIPYYIKEDFKGSQIYGMPSGHAQICFYNLGFLNFVKSTTYKFTNITLLISLIVSLTTLYQRFKYRRHTIQQLFVGSLFGFFISFGIYKIFI
jgi:membrane-associated phospholipid phosphatase